MHSLQQFSENDFRRPSFVEYSISCNFSQIRYRFAFNLKTVKGQIFSDSVLREMATIYRSIHIYQGTERFDTSSDYLFGLYNHNWVPVIVEMFSRKLNMLRIENDNHPKYLSGTDVEKLAEVSICNRKNIYINNTLQRLVMIGKPVWFQTNTASQNIIFENEIYDHHVKSETIFSEK